MSPHELPLVNVVCMKWGTKYPVTYVNRLYAGVKRHLSRPHRFVCFTDDPKGLHPAIETFPIPTIQMPQGVDRGWPKLAMFSKPLGDLQGSALFLDIDIVIVGNLDVFFDLPSAFYIIKDWKRPWRVTGNSSVFRFEVCGCPDILENFEKNYAAIHLQHRNEQEYLSHYMAQKNQLAYWPNQWCQSFKANLVPQFPRNFFHTPVPTPETKIVVFHGSPKPEEAILGMSTKWYRFFKPAPWIQEHWQE